MKKANFWLRFLAFVLDRFLIGMLAKYTFIFFGYYPKLLMTQSEMLKYMDAGNFHISDVIDIKVFIINMIVSSLLVIIYFAICEATPMQATLFKKLFKMKVVDVEGKRISFLRALARNLSKILSGLILLIGFIMALFNKKGQALHDKMTGCIVIDTEA